MKDGKVHINVWCFNVSQATTLKGQCWRWTTTLQEW